MLSKRRRLTSVLSSSRCVGLPLCCTQIRNNKGACGEKIHIRLSAILVLRRKYTDLLRREYVEMAIHKTIIIIL